MTDLKTYFDVYARFTGKTAEQVKKDYEEFGLTHPAIYLLGLEKAKENRKKG